MEELASSGTVIGNLSVEDEDVGQTHTFTLLDSVSDQFALTPEGVLTKAADARLDSKLTYKIAVRATDSGTVPKHVSSKTWPIWHAIIGIPFLVAIIYHYC